MNDNNASINKTALLLVVLLTIIALELRIKYIENTEIYRPIWADAYYYTAYGYNLAAHQTFSQDTSSPKPKPDSFRSPGYPLLIALGYALFGNKGFYSFVLFSQAIMSALLVPITYSIGRHLFPRFYSFLSAMLVVISPQLVTLTSNLLTESQFAFFLSTGILIILSGLKRGHAFIFGLAGFIFGLAYLTNETIFFMPFLVAFFLYGYYRKKKIALPAKLFRKLLLFLFIFSLFPFGWSIRNKISLPADTPRGSERAFASMSHGAYPGFIYKTERFKYFSYHEDPAQPEFGRTFHNFRSILWERFKQRPLRYIIWYLLEKPYYLWSWEPLQGQGDVYIYPVITSYYQVSTMANASRLLMKFLHPIILIISLCGIILFIHKRVFFVNDWFYQAAVIMIIVILYYTVLHCVFAPWPRYSIPLRPILYIWAVFSAKLIYGTCQLKIGEKKNQHNVNTL